jgi:hypothetical protein
LIDNVRYLQDHLRKGGTIVFTTSRDISVQSRTKDQLLEVGFIVDHEHVYLFMGLPHNAPRILVNDRPGNAATAFAFSPERNVDGQLREMLG